MARGIPQLLQIEFVGSRRKEGVWPARDPFAQLFVILSPVLVLYGIYLLCTVALVWTAVAVTRHIVQHRRGNRSQSEHHDESV